jgi:hypothetical protein
MSNKKLYNPLFEPLPDQSFPILGTEPTEELRTGRTGPNIHKEVFGDLSDRELFSDIFGLKLASRSQREIDITLKRHYKKVRKQQR